MYQLDYLPIAKQDMMDIAAYISRDLCNPTAATKLVNELIAAADQLTAFPYQNAIHAMARPLKHEYRKLIVRNYIMFYWIDEKKRRITIARVIYARRNYEERL